MLAEASFSLRAQGRITEALPVLRAVLRMDVERSRWRRAAMAATNLSETQLVVGAIASALADAELSVDYADRSGDEFQMLVNRATRAQALHTSGRREPAERFFADAELRQQKWQPERPLLYSRRGYRYCELLLSKGQYVAAHDRATRTLEWVSPENWLLDVALDKLMLGRASLALSETSAIGQPSAATASDDARVAGTSVDQAVEGLRASGVSEFLPCGLLARAAFRRSVGGWNDAARDLDEVEEIAEPGPMRLFLCECALERARLAFARLEAFAPLNGLVDDSPPKPGLPDAAEAARLTQEATANLAAARKLIADCGYHRRDEELAELEDVAAGRRRFADLPPRV